MKIYLIVLCFTVLGCQAKQKKPTIEKLDYLENYTSDQLKKDLTVLRSELEKYHAGLYRYISKDEMNKIFDQLMTNIDHDMDPVNFIASLLHMLPALIADTPGHNYQSSPDKISG